MTGPGPWKRALALALLTTVIGPAIGIIHPASASAADPETPIFRITFPVVGPSSYHSGFGDCRDGCERSHAGVDIMTQGWKGVPVVAAHSGRVVHITRDSELSGVSIRIRARGGWETRYVHLNNDTPGTDDGFGNGLAPGLAVGDYVSEGQLIGWVGDSGNAEESSPHVHFEIRKRGGEAIDPYPSLRKASRIDFRRIGGDDASQVAALSSQMAYPDGAHLAIVTPTAELPGWLTGEDRPPLVGPQLVVGSGAVPEVTKRELERLSPDVIVIVGDRSGVGVEVESQLRGLARIVERLDPADPSTVLQVPGAAALPSGSPQRSAPFAVRLLDDGRRLRRSATTPLAELGTVASVIRMAVDVRPAADIGIGSTTAPDGETSGVLHLANGTGFASVAAQVDKQDGSASEIPWPTCEGDVIVITRRQATAATLTYLAGLAKAPPQPLWR
jgi:DNA-directed RNA polymerase subunit H (RpoH/RPB5)